MNILWFKATSRWGCDRVSRQERLLDILSTDIVRGWLRRTTSTPHYSSVKGSSRLLHLEVHRKFPKHLAAFFCTQLVWPRLRPV